LYPVIGVVGANNQLSRIEIDTENVWEVFNGEGREKVTLNKISPKEVLPLLGNIC
jgi:hypothetical protein